jgi:ribonuclease PH
MVDGVPLLDLPYSEDVAAEVDLNVVMTAAGNLVEIQGTAEKAPLARSNLDALLNLAQKGIDEIITWQQAAVTSE